mgnify:CR=1 FL=1|tara:strand:+ start:703 stop:873 length:171 start_codon:yes stop_codon:yes gene_type:complete
MNNTMQDIKLYLVNAGSLAISMTHIDMTLKIALLVITIGYTLNRWYLLRKDHNNEN